MTFLEAIGAAAIVVFLLLSIPIGGCLFDWTQARRKIRKLF